MLKELLMAGFLLFGQPQDYKADLTKLQASLKADGVDITTYVKDPRFEIYKVKALNRKTLAIDYTDPKQSKYMWSSSIERSRKFMEDEKDWLSLAERVYGVDKEYVTALLNMESDLGENTGDYGVLNALVSQYLNTNNEDRKNFFYSEIKEFIGFAEERGIKDVLELRGSFAGASGPMQFMPSNLRKYGVDFDGDGSFVLSDKEDAIGSSANFLANKGFKDSPEKSLKAYNPNHPTFATAIQKHAASLKDEAKNK
jgi:membrane-bound lytic murein transglycosylase B